MDRTVASAPLPWILVSRELAAARLLTALVEDVYHTCSHIVTPLTFNVKQLSAKTLSIQAPPGFLRLLPTRSFKIPGSMAGCVAR